MYGIRLDCAAEPLSDNLPSLDRVDSSKGYTIDNVCVISWAANRDKNSLTVDKLLALAEYILNHQDGQKK